MPCTLEPWEIRWEERQRNKKHYGIDLADASLMTRLLCEAVKICRSTNITKEKMSKELNLWAEAHYDCDVKKKEEKTKKLAKPKLKLKMGKLSKCGHRADGTQCGRDCNIPS